MSTPVIWTQFKNCYLIQKKMMKNRVRYICQKCSQNLKRSSHQCDSKDSKFGNKINEPCICTCCHSTFMRRQVVLFEKKNYDFKNKCVDTALSKNFRCKKSIYECKSMPLVRHGLTPSLVLVLPRNK